MDIILEILFIVMLVGAAELVSRRNGNGKLKAELVSKLQSCNTQIMMQNAILAQHTALRGPDRRIPITILSPLAEPKES